MVTSPPRLWPLTDCTTNYRPVLSSQRAPQDKEQSNFPAKKISKIWSWASKGCPTPRHTDWLTVSQSVCLGIEQPCGTSDQILLPVGMLLSEICGLVSVGRPLWREDGFAICSVITQWSESRRTRNHTLLSHLRLPQPGGPGSRIYIPQEQGGPVIPPDTGFPLRLFYDSQGYGEVILTFPQSGGPGSRIHVPQEEGGPVVPPGTWFLLRCPLRLAGLWRRYSNPSRIYILQD
jgi:hypothetical protein